MDYLVFLTGLFLLTAGAGCLFYFRHDPRPTRWPLLAVALLALGLKAWAGILVFALELGNWMILTEALTGGLFAASLLGFCLSPLVHGHRLSFVLKWAAMVGLFGLTFIKGAGDLKSVWFIAPLLAVAFAGGWKFSQYAKALLKPARTVPPLATGLLLATITAVCLLPHVVEICYDVKGQGLSPARVTVLVAVGVAATCGMAFCTIVWGAIYQGNRNQLSRNLRRRRVVGTSMLLAAAFFTLANGAWLAHWLGKHAKQEQSGILLSALQLGANNLDPRLIDQIQGLPEEVMGNPFIALRSKLLDIRKALPGNRFTYLLAMRNDRLVFLVDAENPANTDTFSPPGEPVKDYPQKWQPELAGNATFNGPAPDEWGVWFSAAVPIRNANDKVIALLGVDYPAASWLKPSASRRVAAMGVTLSVTLLLVALFSFHITSIETTRQLEGLSERLSDAMTAAEFDTWECFPKPFRLSAGEQITALLGWSGAPNGPSFRKLWRNIHPDDHYQILGFIRHQGSSEAQVRLRDANGRWLWFMLRGRAIHTSPDEPIRLVGTILNIDERHRSLLEFDKQRRFSQQVIDSAPNGLAVVGHDGIVTYANPEFTRLCRGGSEPLARKPLASLLPEMDSATGAEQGLETTLHCLDGTRIPVQVSSAALYEAQPNKGSILALVDLTATKEAERNLLRRHAETDRLALVAKQTDHAVIITDVTGRIEWVNQGFTKISGYTKEEVLGKSPGSFLQARGNLDPSRLLMHDCLREGKGFETEILNYAKDGRPYIVHIECQPLLDIDGTLTGFMAIERDVTRSRRSNQLLEAVAAISTPQPSRGTGVSPWEEILTALGTAAQVDVCQLFRIHRHPLSGRPAMSPIADWHAESTTSITRNLPLLIACPDRWYQEMCAGREIRGAAGTFPLEEQNLLFEWGVRSLFLIPILSADQLQGVIGFQSCHENREWQNWEISILRSAAAGIGLRLASLAETESPAFTARNAVPMS